MKFKGRKEQDPSSCNCGRSSGLGNGNRISGGEGAIPHEFPWIVRIFGGCAKGLCGGALVSPKIVLSAYHCGYDHDQNDTKLCDHSDGQRFALLGQHHIRSYHISSYPKKYAIPIIRVIAPPNGHFDTSDYNSHDFALFVLERPAVFDVRVRPICLPYKGQEFYGKKSVAAGWGRTSVHSDKQSPVLQKVYLKVNEKRYGYKYMFGTELARGKEEPGDACAGDSGGPLMFYNSTTSKYVLIGTVNGNGYDCKTGISDSIERNTTDGIWNNVASHIDWIEKQMKYFGEPVCHDDQ